MDYAETVVTKSFSVVDSRDRLFEGIASVEMVDKENEIAVRDALLKQFPIWMDRGAPITDTHSNRIVGKALNYSEVTVNDNNSGKSYYGIKILAKINKNYELDDLVWNRIVSGEYKGLSFGGSNKGKKEAIKQADGTYAYKLDDLEVYEVSVCKSPMNPLSVITDFSKVAKSEPSTENGIMVKCVGNICDTTKAEVEYIKGSHVTHNMVQETLKEGHEKKEEEEESEKALLTKLDKMIDEKLKMGHKKEEEEETEKALLSKIGKMIDYKLKEKKEEDETIVEEKEPKKADKEDEDEEEKADITKRFDKLEEQIKALVEVQKEKLGNTFNDGGKDSQPSEDPKDADKEGSDDKISVETKNEEVNVDVSKADDEQWIDSQRPYSIAKALDETHDNAILAKAREVGGENLDELAAMINRGEFGDISNPATRGYPQL